MTPITCIRHKRVVTADVANTLFQYIGLAGWVSELLAAWLTDGVSLVEPFEELEIVHLTLQASCHPVKIANSMDANAIKAPSTPLLTSG